MASSTRRKFVRAASLAGPAVITLKSGRAWALSNCATQTQSQQFQIFGHSSTYQPTPTSPDHAPLIFGQGGGDSDQIDGLTNLSYSC